MHGNHPLKNYRLGKEPKQSQAGLADELGVSRLTVLRWETGERKIGENLLPEIEQKTGIPAKELRPDLVEKYEKLIGVSQ